MLDNRPRWTFFDDWKPTAENREAFFSSTLVLVRLFCVSFHLVCSFDVPLPLSRKKNLYLYLEDRKALS